MGFLELALEDSPYSEWLVDDEDRGRRLVHASMGRLDESWASARRTTLSVMCVVVACAGRADRPLARRLVLSMAGMMSRMCDFWSSNAGSVTAGLPETSELKAESDATDVLGQELGGKADGLLAGVMVTMLVELPASWRAHFGLAADAVRSLGGLLSPDDASWAARQAAEEQRAMMAGLVAELEDATSPGSAALRAAESWAGRARATHAAHAGLGQRAAMAAVVRAAGFPSAG
jgi:hypothetical protein